MNIRSDTGQGNRVANDVLRGGRTVGQHNPFRYQTREIIIRRVGLAHIPTKSQHNIRRIHRRCDVPHPIPSRDKSTRHTIPDIIRHTYIVQD